MWKRVLISVVAVVLTTACIQPEASGGNSNSNDEPAQQQQEAEVQKTSAALDFDQQEFDVRQQLPDVVERVMPAVVGITTEMTVQQRQPRGGFPFGDMFGPHGQQERGPDSRQRRQENVGSGVIVDEEGIVVTNNHVIEAADSVMITLSDGRELEVEVIGTDPASDIAVLQVKDVPDDLTAIAFGDSDSLRLGETVIAIGNPFGLSGTVTMGIISAKGRADVGILDYENFIQTDAAINPGNSGGALINLDGELIGINTAILTRTGGYQGVGFAIPSNMAEMVMTSLMDHGHVSRGWLGVVIQDLSPQLAEALEIPQSTEGVVISDVQPESPAGEYGLGRGDVVTHVDGNRVRSSQELRNTIGLRSPGDEVQLRIVRDDGTEEVTIELGAHDAAELAAAERGDRGDRINLEGLEVEPVDSDLRRQYDIPEAIGTGLVVTGVDRTSEAARYNLREGDVILEVNRQPVTDRQEFNAAYDAERSQNLFLIFRDGSTIFMARSCQCRLPSNGGRRHGTRRR